MDTQDIKVGSHIDHPEHGCGIVTFVGDDYLGVNFEGSGEALIRREAFEAEPESSKPIVVEPKRSTLPWPESTFVPEPPGTKHYLGSHWVSFVEETDEIVARLPAMLEQATVQHGYSSLMSRAKPMPAGWPDGHLLTWPQSPTRAISMVIAVEDTRNVLASMFPFFGEGIQHTVTLREVRVWEGGLEGQIRGTLGPSSIDFFDTRFVIDRAQYVAGQQYDFILAGIAYTAGPAQQQDFKIDQNPEVVAWMNRDLKEGEQPHERQMTINMAGAAILLPIGEWDIDDYSFHGPVKQVREFKDWLGQSGWRLLTTVMRDEDQDIDLDIIVTGRAWTGEAPPRVGQDIEGNLWLQGHLWQPAPQHRQSEADADA